MKKIISLILTGVLLLTFAAFALGSGSSENTTVDKPQTQESDSSQKDAETKTDSSQSDEQSQETSSSSDSSKTGNTRTEVRAGETLNNDGLKITYDGAEKWTSDNQFIKPKEGNMFIRLHFSIQNDSSSDEYVSSSDFECYADDEKCDESYYGDDDLVIESVSPGRKIAGYVYYEVPVGASVIEVEYELSIWSSKKAYFIVEL